MTGILYFLSAFAIFGGGIRRHEYDLSSKACQPIRGIAILLIVIGHTVSHAGSKDLGFLNVGYFGVAIFFMLSGYGCIKGIQNKENYLSGFWHRRLPAILLPFISAHIVYMAVKLFCGETFTVKDILLGLIGECTIVEYSWYPIALLLMYVLFWLSCTFIKESAPKVAIALFGGVVLLTVLEYALLGTKHDWWYISNFSYVIGALLAVAFNYLNCHLTTLVSNLRNK